MTVGIEPEATPETCLLRELLFGRALDVGKESAVGFLLLTQGIGERKVLFLFRHLSIEGINAAVFYGILGRSASLDNERQMLQCLLLPPGHVRDNVFYRPIVRDTRLRHLRV